MKNKSCESNFFKNNKNRKSQLISLEVVIFIILNIAFFVIMLIFVSNSTTNDAVYEQSYAKQIALTIDNAKPGMAILLNAKVLTDDAAKNKKPLEDVIKLDEENNKVIVSLRDGKSYSYRYFSNSRINVKLDTNWITINVGEQT